MRRTRGLFDRLCCPEHLVEAARLTVRGKRRRPAVARFLTRRAEHLTEIRGGLVEGTWRPRGFQVMRIRDPKPRIIAVAPVVDRVVHTALTEAIAPVYLPRLMPEDFACRPGSGVHRAVYALRRAMKRRRFAVHLDVRAFFPSIDVDRLRALLRRHIADGPFLAVLDRVFESGAGLYTRPGLRRFAGLPPDWPPPGRGLPIGTATSQFLATHVYLGGLDHFVKRTLKVPAAVRFVDDLIIFGDRRADLRRWRGEIGRWLADERGLRLKHPEARVISCRGTLNALGHRIRRDSHAALPRARRRFVARMRQVLVDDAGPVDLDGAVAAAMGVQLF